MNYPTPYYIINKCELDDNLNKLRTALKEYWGNYIIGYSYKTNSLPWVIRYFRDNGCFAEVVSDDEYLLAKSIGVADKKVIYNGIIKSKETFLEAIKNGCIVNIDSQREIEWLDELPSEMSNGVGVRVNFDIEKYCPNQSSGGNDGGRFGFCYENGELEKTLTHIKEKGIDVVGLHLHVSSRTRSVDIYNAIANMACEISKRYGLSLSYVDIGGGFFGGLEDKPQFRDYLRVVCMRLKECFNPMKTMLIVEPGMSLIGAPISYETSVIDVKETTYGRFVVTDGSRTNIDPLMTKKSYFCHLQKNDNLQREIIEKQVVCGFTCMENDRLFTQENEEEIQVGDRIIYNKVGAYTMCLTPLFIKYFPDVYVDDGMSLELVRDRWQPTNYVQGSR